MNKLLFITALFFCAPAWASVDGKLIREMLTMINTDYLKPVKNDEIVINGLQALTDLDSDIIISKGSDKFYIYYKKQIKKIIPLPQNNDDIAAWSQTATQIADETAELSEKISLKDFEIPDLMLKKITSKLDKFSHYYSEYDYSDDKDENAIYTLYSDRKIDDILYLRVRIFNKQTAKAVQGSLERNKPYLAIILDLRGNSGGIFNEALKVADFFTENEIITYTSGRENSNQHYYTSKENSLYSGPLAIIVDGDTASAAEVLAAGLQDQSRAKIIGTQTFGKGTIQNVIQMSNGGKLVLTTEQFFTPSGKIIHNNGVTPDICVVRTEDGSCGKESRLWEDSDLQTAIKFLKNEL